MRSSSLRNSIISIVTNSWRKIHIVTKQNALFNEKLNFSIKYTRRSVQIKYTVFRLFSVSVQITDQCSDLFAQGCSSLILNLIFLKYYCDKFKKTNLPKAALKIKFSKFISKNCIGLLLLTISYKKNVAYSDNFH